MGFNLERMSSDSGSTEKPKTPWDMLTEESELSHHDVDVDWTLKHEMDEGAPQAHYPGEDEIESSQREQEEAYGLSPDDEAAFQEDIDDAMDLISLRLRGKE